MLTSIPPFFEISEDPEEVKLHIMRLSGKLSILHKEPPPYPESISDECKSFLDTCFQIDPKKRGRA
jgi:serine/threonine protein kinase